MEGEQVIGTVQIPEESSEPTLVEWHTAKTEKYQAPTQPPPGLPWALTTPRDMNPVAVGLRDTILTVSSLHSSECSGDPPWLYHPSVKLHMFRCTPCFVVCT